MVSGKFGYHVTILASIIPQDTLVDIGYLVGLTAPNKE